MENMIIMVENKFPNISFVSFERIQSSFHQWTDEKWKNVGHDFLENESDKSSLSFETKNINEILLTD